MEIYIWILMVIGFMIYNLWFFCSFYQREIRKKYNILKTKYCFKKNNKKFILFQILTIIFLINIIIFLF